MGNQENITRAYKSGNYNNFHCRFPRFREETRRVERQLISALEGTAEDQDLTLYRDLDKICRRMNFDQALFEEAEKNRRWEDVNLMIAPIFKELVRMGYDPIYLVT